MIDLLKIALAPNATNEQRKQAEMKIMEYRSVQPIRFIKDCAGVFTTEPTVEVRQAAYALLRRTMIQKTPEVNTSRWQQLSPEDNLLIKSQLLNSLAAPSRVIKRCAADLIATIGNIEIPLGRWPEIVNILTSNTKNQNQDISLSATLTLGSLCELMKERGATACGITLQQTEAILTGLMHGLQSASAEIRETSLKAVADSIQFVRELLGHAHYRQYTFNQLMGIKNPSPQDLTHLLSALSEFAKVCYVGLSEHLEAMFKLTMPFIQNPKDSDLCELSMNIWDTIAVEYNELKSKGQPNLVNYLGSGEALLRLTDALLANLCYVDDDEDFENSVRGSAYRTLYSIGVMSADQMFNRVLQFVSSNIGHQDQKHRQASLRAMCTLMEGADTVRMQSALANALLQFVRMLDDNSKEVQSSAAFCLSKIAEFFPDCYVQHIKFPEVLEAVVSKLSRPVDVSLQLCNVFMQLADHCKNQPSQVLDQWVERLSTALIANAFRSDMPERDLSLADRSFVAVMTLIYNTHNWQFCLKYVPLLMLEFPKTYAISLEKRTIIQSGLFTLTHACLLTLEAKKQTNLSDDILSSVFNTVIGHFKAINDVTADGIYLLGTLSSFKKVPAYLESVWPYIKHSLAKYNEQTMFKAALGALVDLARNNSQAFGQEPYINIMVDLLKAVKVSEIDKELKLSIFSCIGDIIIFVNGSQLLVSYQKELMDVLVMGYQGSIHIMDNEPEYAENLRQIMVDTTTCVIHTLQYSNRSDELFRAYIPKVFEFVTLHLQLSHKKLTMEFVESALMMLIDILKFYSKETAAVGEGAKAPVLEVAIGILERNNKRGKFTNSINFARQIIRQIGLARVI